MILKLEPYSGISGDMFLGALAPLLHAEDEIIALPKRLGLAGVEVRFENVIRSTIQCRKATVTVQGEAPASEQHDHDHDHSHSDDHDGHHHKNDHGHDHSHSDDPKPTHDHQAHSHSHRAYVDIVQLISHADLPEGARAIALDLFKKLGEAEAEMHGMPLEEVHFHEVGGEDAIVDLVGAALLIDKLKPEAVYSTPICVGSGFVKTAHGRLPVPAPATQKLLEGFPTFQGPIAKEMCTPTGAAIYAVLKPNFSLPTLITTQTNLGAGTRDLDQPNALRLSFCQTTSTNPNQEITLLETNLDNSTGEDVGADLLQALLDQGALDAWLTPILMKKGRPANQLSILCEPSKSTLLSEWVLTNLPTLGVRKFSGSRQILERSVITVETPYGKVDVKVHELPNGENRYFPEYESCKKLAKESGKSLQHIRDAAKAAT